MSTRKRYTKSFKLEAVRQMIEAEKPVTLVARELGVLRKDLYRWKQEFADKGGDGSL
ncbi:MAG: transposase [Gammaproteobacteria bacterium]